MTKQIITVIRPDKKTIRIGYNASVSLKDIKIKNSNFAKEVARKLSREDILR